jgi:hypothetical protein
MEIISCRCIVSNDAAPSAVLGLAVRVTAIPVYYLSLMKALQSLQNINNY